MKALLLEDYNRLVYTEVPEPDLGDHDVLVDVMACGICGSDVHGLDGSTGRRIPPLIMGHEASGIIRTTGKKVTTWKAGDRVTFDSTVYPLDDWYTLRGHYNLSDNREVLGVSPGNYRRHGAFAEWVAIPGHILYALPPEVTFVQAAVTEPVAVALHALSLAGVLPGESCLITGAGMIGLCLVQAVAAAGAGPILVSDPDPGRLEKALTLGATVAIRADSADAAGIIAAHTQGRGADVAFDAVGVQSSVQASLEGVRKGGKVILVGNLARSIDFPLQSVVTREITLRGSCAIRGEYETALRLISNGKIQVDPLISAVAPLSEGANWFSRLYNKEPGLGKVILVPDRHFPPGR